MKADMTARQALGWCFCSLCVPVTLVCAARPWQQVLAASAAVCLIYIIMYKLQTAPLTETYRAALGAAAKPALLLTATFQLFVCAAAAAKSADVYGDAPQAKLCAAAVVLLAAWTVLHPSAGAQCAAVLAPMLAVGFSAFLLSALPQLEPSYLAPAPTPAAPELLAALLVPSALWFLPARNPARAGGALAALLFVPPLVSALTLGVLGMETAQQEPLAFYTLAESLSLFSAIERFEPLVSALLFAAFYLLASLLLESSTAQLAAVFPTAKKTHLTALCAAPTFLLAVLPVHLPQTVCVIASVLFWGFLPLGTLLLVAAKKDEKNLKKVVDKGVQR